MYRLQLYYNFVFLSQAIFLTFTILSPPSLLPHLCPAFVDPSTDVFDGRWSYPGEGKGYPTLWHGRKPWSIRILRYQRP